ncbi:hypothetical protein CH368_08625 [Leptospira levettii]|nr:hypothetical protein CH368_08625 [Leptospira levettii]
MLVGFDIGFFSFGEVDFVGEVEKILVFLRLDTRNSVGSSTFSFLSLFSANPERDIIMRKT